MRLLTSFRIQSCHRVCHPLRRLAWASFSSLSASTQPHSELITILRCHCRLLEYLSKLDLSDLRDRRFALPLAQIAQLPSLRSLSLPPLRKIESDVLPSVRGLKLHRIKLTGSESLSSDVLAHFLSTQPQLTSLDISFCRSLDQSIIPPISKLKELRSLRLEGSKGLTNLGHLSSLPSLEKLTLHLADVSNDAFDSWNQLPPSRLQVLDLLGTRTTEVVLRVVSKISTLTRLHLAESSVSDISAPLLGKLHKLTNLAFVRCNNLSGLGLRHFSALTNVARLELRNQPTLSVADWSFVDDLKMLSHVSIVDMKEIDDEVVRLFSDLPFLSKFTASPNVMTFAGLYSLSSNPITSLFLKSSGILDDRAVAVLIENYPLLSDLHLQSCPMLSTTAQNALLDWSKTREMSLVQ